MSNFRPQFNSFNAGEWAPTLSGRTDLEKYGKACLTMDNMVAQKHGGAFRRRGFEFLFEIPGVAAIERLEFDDSTAYVSIWGVNTLQIAKSGELIEDLDGTDTIATPYNADEIFDLQFAQSFDVVWVMHENHPVYRLNRFSDNNWTFDEVDWTFPPLLDLNTSEITITPSATTGDGITLTASDDLFDPLQVGGYFALRHLRNDAVQEGDFQNAVTAVSLETDVTDTVTLTTTGGSWEGTIVLESRNTGTSDSWFIEDTFTRVDSGQANFSVAVVSKDLQVRMDSQISGTINWNYNSSQKTGSFTLNITKLLGEYIGDWSLKTGGIWTGNLKLERSYDGGQTWSPYQIISSESDNNESLSGTESVRTNLRLNMFNHTSGEVSWDFTMLDGYITGFCKITSIFSPTIAIADVKLDFSSTTSTRDWYEGAWSDYRGFPTSSDFFGERFYFGDYGGIHASVVGDYQNFERTNLDDGGIYYPLPSRDRNKVRWVIARRQIILGTTGGIWAIRSPTNSEVITPSNIRADKELEFGVGGTSAIPIDDVVLFTQRGDTLLRELYYTIERDGFVAETDLTLLASHITKGGIHGLAYQQNPTSILWAIRNDGVLLSMVYQRVENVIAWSHHETAGTFESIAVMDSGSVQELYCVVKREINGETKYYIERAQTVDVEANTIEVAQANGMTETRPIDYVDSYLIFTGTDLTSVSGLTHLENELVWVVGDGAVVGQFTVVDATVAWDAQSDGEFSTVIVGLDYQSFLKPMDFEPYLEDGSSRDRKKNVTEIRALVYETLGIEAGRDENSLTFASVNPKILNSPADLISTDIKIDLPATNQDRSSILIASRQPLPANIQAIYPIIAIER